MIYASTPEFIFMPMIMHSRNKKVVRCIQLVAMLLTAINVSANNLQITNPSLVPVNDISNAVYIKFDISWENSFRLGSGTKNWDAAWVFVKYRVAIASGGDGVWRHVRLNQSLDTRSQIYTADIKTEGAFIYRSVAGAGNFNAAGIQFQWNYSIYLKSADGKTIALGDAIEVQIFGIEMIYVPGNQFFQIGGVGTNAFPKTGISTADASVTGSGYPTGISNTNAAFPNGYQPFYCMKYEISQQQYIDFLNTLTYTQQQNRTATSPAAASGTGAMVGLNTFRNGIDIKTAGSASAKPAEYASNLDGDKEFAEANDGQWIACNFLSWGDIAAYLDWSGLRPMSEMEYEKACRGTTFFADAEYAWGTTALLGATAIKNPATAEETYGNPGANVCYGNSIGVQGPLRVGSFAAGSTARATSGATAYGIMEMSGNLWERAVTATVNPAFSGIHGNGELTATGSADVNNWPPAGGQGAGFRGGSWLYLATGMRIADRTSVNYTFGGRDKDNGGRGARSAN
jgi:formylglycine-generating enzyme required for sulfatase activity